MVTRQGRGLASGVEAAAQVGADVMAEPPGLPAVEQGTRRDAGEQGGKGKSASARAGGQPPLQPPGHRGTRGQDHAAQQPKPIALTLMPLRPRTLVLISALPSSGSVPG